VILAAALLVAWNFYWVLTNEPEHDEAEHWHVAWLMHQGQTPFYDFFEHHSPLFWMLLGLYFKLFGVNYGLILASRLFMILVFAGIIVLGWRLARRWAGPAAAWIAVLGFPLLNLGYFHAHLTVRADPLILLSLLAAMNLAAHLADRRPWSGRDGYRLAGFFLCLAGAVAFSPRAGIPALTLFLALGFLSRDALPRRRLFAVFLGGGVLVLIPTLLLALPYGLEVYLFWVFKFSASVLPVFSPLIILQDILRGTWVLLPLVLAGALAPLWAPSLRRRSYALLLIMAGANLAGLWASTHPYMQHFLMTLPFVGLLAGPGYDQIMRVVRSVVKIPVAVPAVLFLAGGLLLLSAKTHIMWKWRAGGMDCRRWVECHRWLRERAGDTGTAAASTAFFHPLFVQQTYYYWFAVRYAGPTLLHMGRDFDAVSFENVRGARPVILHESFFLAWNLLGSSECRAWLKANYEPAPYKDYWVLKERLAAAPPQTTPENPPENRDGSPP